jgi:hypothetical protein
LARIEEENAKMTFWTKNDKGIIKIIHVLFKQFLEDNGFYKFCPEGGRNYVFVKVTNNLIDHTSEKEIKDFVLNYLLDLDDVSVYNYFADNTRFFKEEFLSLLSTIEIYFIADTKDSSYLYYKNCAVKISRDGITTIDYLDLGGYVWKDHVIDRVFNVGEVTDDCTFRKFISNINSYGGLARPNRYEVILPLPQYINKFVTNSVVDRVKAVYQSTIQTYNSV